MNGKGSHRRPCQVSPEVLAANWDRVFGTRPNPRKRGQRRRRVVHQLVDAALPERPELCRSYRAEQDTLHKEHA
jgi:hypothetical protein